MNPRIKIRHLQAFTSIVRKKSLKLAAEQLHLTQPAISRTLSELEDILGARLLNRDRSGVEMTAQGAFFLSFAEASLGALERGVTGLSDFGRDSGLKIRLGVTGPVAARLIPAVAAALAEDLPEMQLTLQEAELPELLRGLGNGATDLVIAPLGAPDAMASLNFAQLYTERAEIGLRPGHPLFQAAPDLRRITDWPVIYPPPEDPLRPAVRRWLVGEGIPLPPRRTETSSAAFGLEYCLQADALWLTAEGVLAPHFATGRLARLAVDTAGTEQPVGLISRAGQDQPTEERLILPVIRRAVQALALT